MSQSCDFSETFIHLLRSSKREKRKRGGPLWANDSTDAVKGGDKNSLRTVGTQKSVHLESASVAKLLRKNLKYVLRQ